MGREVIRTRGSRLYILCLRVGCLQDACTCKRPMLARHLTWCSCQKFGE